MDQKTSLTTIVQFGMIFESFIQKVKVKLSCGQKAVILSLAMLSIDSKNFFDKNGSVWYAIWEGLKKSESSYSVGSQSCHFIAF